MRFLRRFRQQGRAEPTGSGGRYKILVVARDGEALFWHKGGELHVVDEDVARSFVERFDTSLFEVTEEGSLLPPESGRTKPILRVDMIPI